MTTRLVPVRLLLALALALSGLVLLAPVRAVAAEPTLADPTDLPTSFPYQPELAEVPANPADQSIPRGSIAYHDIAPKLNAWMDQSDLISTQVVGQSSLGRDIHLVTMTAPESEAETAQQAAWKREVKYDAAAAAEDQELLEGYKRPIWFNNNIHGNEWEGTDASLAYIEYLLENENSAEVRQLMRENRIYFTLTNNPDGRVAGTRATALGFDPNRDFITNTLPETQIIRGLSSSIQPIFFSDIHGYTSVLQVEPTGPPHGENYEYDLFVPHAYASALRIQKDIVEADIPGNTYYNKATNQATTAKTGLIKIPYRDTPSGWDDWPPIFTAQYVAYQGAVASTVELPLARSNNATTHLNNGRINQVVALKVIESTVDYIVENSDELLENQIEIFRRGAAGEALRDIPANPDPANYPGPDEWAAEWGPEDVTGTTFPRAYVIPVGTKQRSATDSAYLVNFLRKHDVEVERATKPFTAGGTDYPAGSYVVDMHQPLRGLANAILAAGSDISLRVASMYDISAWSNGYLWGADVDRIGATSDEALSVESETIESAAATGKVPSRVGSYLTFDLVGVDAFRGLNALLAQGVKVSSVPGGKAVLGNDQATYDAASAVATAYGVPFRATNGSELAAPGAKPLSKLKVGWTGSSSDDLTSLRQMGFADDQLVALSSTAINAGTVDLSTLDVIYLGAGLTFTGTQTAGTAAMQAYVASGKGFVGRGTGASTFANTWLGANATAVTGRSDGNGIVRLATKADGVLGGIDTEWGFVSPAVSFALGEGSTGTVEQSYAAVENPAYATQGALLSGHWRRTTDNNGPDYVVGRASVYSAQAASGAKGLVFGTSVTYRTHPRGHFSEILAGLYWTAKPAANGLVAPNATTTTLDLQGESQTFGGEPSTAVVKVATGAGNLNRTGTVEILLGDEVLGEGTVNSFGNAEVVLPADLPVGEHELVASYVPRPGSTVGTSTSEPATLTVVGAPTETALEIDASSHVQGATDPATATVTVSGSVEGSVPAGEVSLRAGDIAFGTGTLDEGVATVEVDPAVAPGTYSIEAVYTPAEGSPYEGSTSDPVTFTVEAPPIPQTFSDVPPTHTFFTHIAWLVERGLIKGFADGTFRPSSDVTRGQLAVMIYKYEGSPEFTPPTTSPFRDLPTTHSFYKHVTWMVEEGLIKGYGDGTFRANGALSRGQAAVVLYKLAGEPAFTPPTTSPFPDVPVGHTFYKHIAWLESQGVIKGYGDGTFRPSTTLTRGQTAVVLKKFDALPQG